MDEGTPQRATFYLAPSTQHSALGTQHRSTAALSRACAFSLRCPQSIGGQLVRCVRHSLKRRCGHEKDAFMPSHGERVLFSCEEADAAEALSSASICLPTYPPLSSGELWHGPRPVGGQRRERVVSTTTLSTRTQVWHGAGSS